MEQIVLHKTVLLKEAIEALAIRPNGYYIDGTYGRGGHSQAILEQLDESGRLLVIDQDPDALKDAHSYLGHDERFSLWHGGFQDFPQAIKETWGEKRRIDGLLLDLGVSSPQLDQAERGFSFQRDGTLDMRMNPSEGLSAAQWLAKASEQVIAQVLWRYGEERYSRRIARNIIKMRDEKPLVTTKQLAALVAQSIPQRGLKKHPATRSFQAIRIHINNELSALEQCLEFTTEKLKDKARLVVISFHSLEDRIVKRFLRRESQGPIIPRGLPVMSQDIHCNFKMINKAMKPSREEIERNVRARSAIMRIGERMR